jgi:hypothetical protein
VHAASSKVGDAPKFEILGSLGFGSDGNVQGTWDVKGYAPSAPLNEDEVEENAVRGRWNVETNEVGRLKSNCIPMLLSYSALIALFLQVFLDEYDGASGLISTAHINGKVNFSTNSMDATDEDGDLWQMKFIENAQIVDPRK